MHKSAEEDKILMMEFHEIIWLNSILMEIVRVHNGWLYSKYDNKTEYIIQQTFVPDTRRALMT